jgi:hypothetical protein
LILLKVVRRPFAFIYSHEKDPVERALINLGTARIEFNDEDIANGTRVCKKFEYLINCKVSFVLRVLVIHFLLFQNIVAFLFNR